MNYEDEMLDRAIEAIREDTPDAATVEAAGRRAWAAIAAEASAVEHADHIGGCAGFQALLPLRRSGQLTAAKRMLLEDHLHECVTCRRLSQGLTVTSAPAPTPAPAPVIEMKPRRRIAPAYKWVAAAAAMVTIGWFAYQQYGPAPAGPRATVLAADGTVFVIRDGAVTPARAGEVLNDREALRTATGAHASVRLSDGSVIEVADRAELSVSASRQDTTVRLDRGRIIVQAAKRSSGHLFVDAPDSRVAVTGTVFAVSSGIKGSRVSVAEGEVHVSYGGRKDVLQAGDQTVTSAWMFRTGLADDFEWSPNYEKYAALLRQVAELKEKLEAVPMPGLRYSSRLLDSVPAGTTFYATIPNMGRSLGEAQRLIEAQMQQSPELREWVSKSAPEILQSLRWMEQLGEYLGEEITFAAQECQGFCPVMIAEVTRPGLRQFIEAEMAKQAFPGSARGYRIIENGAVPANPDRQLLIVLSGNRLVVGEQPQLVQAALAGNSGFRNTSLGQAVTNVFRRGTGILLAADMARMAPAREFGLKHLIAEHRQINGEPQQGAVLSFNGPRQGVASWLAAPGAIGGLDFVSPEAQFAIAAVVKEPAAMLNDLGNVGILKDMLKIREILGVDLRNEVAPALGGELTIAMDGPLLPVPSWKLILEVHSPAAVQAAVERATSGKGQVTTERAGGRTYHTVRFEGVTFHYLYTDGYLVAAPSRALLEQSLRNRDAGRTLTRSPQFTRLLPRDHHTHFSGIFYQNPGEAGRMAAELLGQGALGQHMEPMVAAAYGGTDQIEVVSRASVLDLMMQAVLSGAAVHGTNAPVHSYR
jgi:ferric-dicitrate binding protein FerR (iron transport regulator)